MCSIRVAPSKTKGTSTYSVAPEVPVPGTGTSGLTRSDRWSLGPSRSDRCERLGPIGSSTGTSGQTPEVNPHARGHAQRLLCGLPFMDRNFRLWTGTSGHGPELPVRHRKCFLKRERTSHSPTGTSCQADRNFRSGTGSTTGSSTGTSGPAFSAPPQNLFGC